MKLSLVATALLALTSTIGMAQTIPQRQFNQQGRIAQGVRSGQLTGRETRGLERREFSIHRQERAMRRANYGRLNHRDRAILNHRLNRTSRAIYRNKHNAFRRG
ncbi:MAG: hypothetical protein WA891_05410 [Acidobacteriaceae bacterium]